MRDALELLLFTQYIGQILGKRKKNPKKRIKPLVLADILMPKK